ncbi:MAG TPA: orotidine-5'-phosphate decarboxylase [Terrimesophilobacter sp.]|uniref:orotidine-5'-phosphate decarboxylase n=1 Tax=Terrimesophilobacter sp. TaxID=2906435 RepID=UPI002F924374
MLVEPSQFGERLSTAFADHGRLCVGIDPHPYLLDGWELPDSAEGLREFGLRVIEAAAGRVGIVKPQVAFFERFGSAGYAALELVMAAARQAGLLLIADVKRGDIGSTVEAYGQAWLAPGGPLEADAMTMSAFQGVGSLAAPIAFAQEHGKGIFVLAATSNPESVAAQKAIIGTGEQHGLTVAAGIVDGVIDVNRATSGAIGAIGVVLGATADLPAYGIEVDRLVGPPATPVLAPGVGRQGAAFEHLRMRYRQAAPYTIVTASRSVLDAGPRGLAEAMTRHAGELAACLG